jgi:hypothetical protein
LLIVTLNVQDELPQLFVAVQVTTVVPKTNVLPEAGEQLTVGVGVPDADGSEYVTTGLKVVMSFGHAPITGLSFIVTLKVQLDEPHELVAVHVTTVVPAANVEPDAGEHETVGAGSPVAVGVDQVATWLSHCAMSEGHEPITGAVLM